jgi:hypothetical protein
MISERVAKKGQTLAPKARWMMVAKAVIPLRSILRRRKSPRATFNRWAYWAQPTYRPLRHPEQAGTAMIGLRSGANLRNYKETSTAAESFIAVMQGQIAMWYRSRNRRLEYIGPDADHPEGHWADRDTGHIMENVPHQPAIAADEHHLPWKSGVTALAVVMPNAFAQGERRD